MSVALLLAGLLLLVVTAVDAFWTTLWVDGNAGPLAGRSASLLRKLFLRIVPDGHHRLLSVAGPLVLIQTILIWAVLLWAGWTLVYSSSAGAITHTHTGAPADLLGRIYFVGYTIFTLGNGDFSPRSGGWQLTTALATMSGLILITLAVTYLLALLQAVVQKRSFGSHVSAMAHSGVDLVLSAWDGKRFREIELQVAALTERLSQMAEQHAAYPMLHYYHEASLRQSVSYNLAILDDALVLLEFGVAPEARPAPSTLRPARGAARSFLDTVRTAHVQPAERPPPPPPLGRLRAAGIPTVADAEFAAALAPLDEHRKLMKGFLDGEQREWPRHRTEEDAHSRSV